jgi:hypothetical protein
VVGSAVGLAAVAPGCGSSKESETSAQPRAQPVPRSLGQAESSAEDTIDYALAGKRARVVTKARELQKVAEGAAGAALRDADVPEDRVSSFQDRARRVDELAPRSELLRVSLAANQVSALMPEFYARYADRVPPEVLKLDYLDREAKLRSLAGDQAAVQGAASQLSTTWTKLRPQVIKAGGVKVAASYTRHVGAIRRLAPGSDESALQREAATGLDLVDLLEDVFRKK